MKDGLTLHAHAHRLASLLLVAGFRAKFYFKCATLFIFTNHTWCSDEYNIHTFTLTETLMLHVKKNQHRHPCHTDLVSLMLAVSE